MCSKKDVHFLRNRTLAPRISSLIIVVLHRASAVFHRIKTFGAVARPWRGHGLSVAMGTGICQETLGNADIWFINADIPNPKTIWFINYYKL